MNLSIAIIPMSHQFGWNSSTAGLVQSSFFWGYALSQLPGGWLAKVFGGRSVSNLFFFDKYKDFIKSQRAYLKYTKSIHEKHLKRKKEQKNKKEEEIIKSYEIKRCENNHKQLTTETRFGKIRPLALPPSSHCL